MAGAGDDRAPNKKLAKQAVLLVHGIGEQMPMETLRGFVETTWSRDPGVVPWTDDPDGRTDAFTERGNKVWFKPDSRNDSSELWRITTQHERRSGQRVDFYELYWADLTAGTTLDHVKDFFLFLLVRRPYQVPERVKPIWRILWAATLIVVGLAVWQALAAAGRAPTLAWWASGLIFFGGAIYAASVGAVVAVAGDVARYCRAMPPNIAARRGIRERGLARLRRIAESGEYDRIVLVGHSLGSIVAYDLLKIYWAEWAEGVSVRKDGRIFSALKAAREAGDVLDKLREGASAEDRAAALAAFRDAQAATFRAISAHPRSYSEAREAGVEPPFRPWLISDFITVGAALSHAEFLLAKDGEQFQSGREEERFPKSPPLVDGQFGYVFKGAGGRLRIDHSTCFSAVRWTNIHDDAKAILRGDLVSGPCSGLFGAGVKDVPVTIWHETQLGGIAPRLFTHTSYWTDTRSWATGDEPAQLAALREALDFSRRRTPAA